MSLVDLKYTPAEKLEEAQEVGLNGQPADYPWGLTFRLEQEELDKLSLSGRLEINGEIHFNAVAKITSLNQMVEDGEVETCAGMQITMMEITSVESAAEEAGEVETPDSEARETRSLIGGY